MHRKDCVREYDLEGLGRHNFEQIAWERRNYKQVMVACAAGRGLADGSHGNRQRCP